MIAVKASCRIYRVILSAYPLRLRAEFGPDMLYVFEQQLLDARSDGGLRRIIRVWARAIGETARIFVEERLSPAPFSIAFVSVMSSTALFLFFFWAAGFANRCVK